MAHALVSLSPVRGILPAPEPIVRLRREILSGERAEGTSRPGTLRAAPSGFLEAAFRSPRRIQDPLTDRNPGAARPRRAGHGSLGSEPLPC